MSARRAALFVLVAALAVAIWRLLPLGLGGGGVPTSAPAPGTDASSRPPAASAPMRAKRAPLPPVAGECPAHARKLCDGGDVWWFDGCGRRENLIETCGDRLCADARCSDPPPGPACGSELTERGHCDGDLLRYCDGKIARAVDCAELGQRCGIDADGGANCVRVQSCKGQGELCVGRNVLRCEGGKVTGMRCAKDAACVLAAGHARCERRLDAQTFARDPCRGCACPAEAPAKMVVDVVAFLIADADGHPVESEDRVWAEIERTNQLLSPDPPDPAHDTGITLALRDMRILVRPKWIAATRQTLREAAFDPEVQSLGEPFFIPLLYTREVMSGAKQASGMSTLPNGLCANFDVLRNTEDAPSGEAGAVLLARLRSPTTLAHELGHYLGLCHTFQPDLPFDEVTLVDSQVAPECRECERRGDGVCDTPPDPGVDDGACQLAPGSCEARCSGDAVPDTANLMSYYTLCRRWFTSEQIGYMRKWLDRRLSWRK
jgi:hypothetical protein